jgi:predicted metal-dependent hydrolase
VADTTIPQPTTSRGQPGVGGWSIPTRRISFADHLDGLPRHFAEDDNLILSHLAAAMSAIFAEAEEYLIGTVRHFRDQITDPDLKRQVAAFIGQESVHGREHRAVNDRFADLGYPTKKLEWMVRQYMGLQTRVRPPGMRLAHTAASEHITAALSEEFMRDPAARASFGAAVGDICLWHGLEELEHKAVAFDVYRALGGSEARRRRAAREMRWSLAAGAVLFVVVSLLGDPATYRRGNLRRSWRQFQAWPLLRREVWARFTEYDRTGFHPDDRDTTALVETWRAALFGADGTLAPLLADARRVDGRRPPAPRTTGVLNP